MATQVSLNSGAVASAGALALQTNGTTQAVSISTGQVATLAQNPILTSGTENGVAYLNGSKALTTGSALVFDGSNLGIGTSSPAYKLETSSSTNNYIGVTCTTDGNAASRFKNNQRDWLVGVLGGASGAFAIYDITSSTQRLTLNANGVLALQGASTSATGVGITFPATQSASSDANTLDDYEEGTWTPNQGAGLTVVGTFNSTGSYTKVGRIVTVNAYFLGTTSITLSASGVICSNLPFGVILDSIGTYSTGQNNTTAAMIGFYAYNSSMIYYGLAASSANANQGFYVSLTYQTS